MCGRCRNAKRKTTRRRLFAKRRRRRRTHQQGGIIPLILMAGKAIATSALSAGAKYGAKKALEKRKPKKIVRPPDMTFAEERDIRRVLGL